MRPSPTQTPAALRNRLWRVRKRHDHLDALLRGRGHHWTLEFRRNDRPLVARDFGSRAAARAEADARLRELQRAGWTVHW
jgi:hypothetical protein